MKTVYCVIIIAGLVLFGLYASGFLNRFIIADLVLSQGEFVQ